MITVIIETRDHELPLANALVALVPAALEGVVREVVVVDYGSSDGTLEVADAAGCTILRAADETTVAHVATNARGEWLLFMSPPATLAPGWQGDAMAFIDRALVSGRARATAAPLRKGTIDRGLLRWVRAWLSPSAGRLVSKGGWLAASPSSQASEASSASGVRRGAA